MFRKLQTALFWASVYSHQAYRNFIFDREGLHRLHHLAYQVKGRCQCNGVYFDDCGDCNYYLPKGAIRVVCDCHPIKITRPV